MCKSRFSEAQIIILLKEVEKGRTVTEVCRGNAVSEATYYQWKTKYGGLEAADISRLRDLEAETRRLKQMFAALSFENRALKEVIAKKLSSRQHGASWLIACGMSMDGVSVERAPPSE